MPSYDRNAIAQLEERLVVGPGADEALADLEMLADLYMQADSYVPALETIERLLTLPGARTLSAERRAALDNRAIACRLAKGDCQGALAHCREVLQDEGGIAATGLRSRLHLQCAEALFRIGRLEDAREEARRGLDLADECGELVLCAHGLNQLGRILYRQGDLLQARDLYEQALALYRRLGDESTAAYVRNNLGLIHKNLCEWPAAAACLEAALDQHRAGGRLPASANTLLNLGIVHQKRGAWDLALDCYLQADGIYRQLGDALRLSLTGIALGNVARLQRRFEDAATALQGALERARAQGAMREEVLALEFLGELAADRGEPTAALAHYDDALARARRVAAEGDLVVEIERRRAETLCALGRLDEADEACARARRLARQTDDRLEYALTHRAAGSIAWARGQRLEAEQGWSSAAQRLGECHERYELARTLLVSGLHARDARTGRRQLYRAGALFAELGAAWWLEHTEEAIERLQSGEPAAVAPAGAPSTLGRRNRAPRLVACSPAMQRVEALARRAASTDLSVLITGETGTGKELIARTIHMLSTRSAGPFLALNCGALRADLALSQLFGHRKGAFTGAHADGIGLVEAAHGGTLFLDEVGELPADVQVTLLRFLESGEYLRLGETRVRRADVRVIAATNRELRGLDGERLFRRDLLFRLNEIEIRVPALRERADDLVPLARHFLAFYGGMDGPRLSPGSEAMLRTWSWPGNVRELENVMKRIAALHAGEAELDAETLLPFFGQVEERRSDPREDERRAILSAFERARGNKSRVAELLGVSRKTLYARLKRLQIVLP
ncbi:MAG TPA: sigma 54-interacting transcriptional regulator [Candidatus Eisenbacteria bacterium]|nr:sigma 54-interacting transcriptional regulator [Candidatus Eisenbacteria bacterium]